MKKDIYVNSRKLNVMQRYLFNKSNKFIDRVLNIAYISIVSILMTILWVSFQASQGWPLLISFTLFIVITIFMPAYIDARIFIKKGYHGFKRTEQIKEVLNKSWIINEEMVERLLGDIYFFERNIGDARYKILKYCFGHPIFNRLKRSAIKKMPELISYYEDPTREMVAAFMYERYEAGKDYKIRAPFDFSQYEKNTLQAYYAKVKNIKLENDFLKKSIGVKSKEELISFLNKELVLRVENE